MSILNHMPTCERSFIVIKNAHSLRTVYEKYDSVNAFLTQDAFQLTMYLRLWSFDPVRSRWHGPDPEWGGLVKHGRLSVTAPYDSNSTLGAPVVH